MLLGLLISDVFSSNARVVQGKHRSQIYRLTYKGLSANSKKVYLSLNIAHRKSWEVGAESWEDKARHTTGLVEYYQSLVSLQSRV